MLIKGLGITKTKFADDLGTSRWLVHQWLNGKVNPGAEYLKKIERTFNVVLRPTYPESEEAGDNRQAHE